MATTARPTATLKASDTYPAVGFTTSIPPTEALLGIDIQAELKKPDSPIKKAIYQAVCIMYAHLLAQSQGQALGIRIGELGLGRGVDFATRGQQMAAQAAGPTNKNERRLNELDSLIARLMGNLDGDIQKLAKLTKAKACLAVLTGSVEQLATIMGIEVPADGVPAEMVSRVYQVIARPDEEFAMRAFDVSYEQVEQARQAADQVDPQNTVSDYDLRLQHARSSSVYQVMVENHEDVRSFEEQSQRIDFLAQFFQAIQFMHMSLPLIEELSAAGFGMRDYQRIHVEHKQVSNRVNENYEKLNGHIAQVENLGGQAPRVNYEDRSRITNIPNMPLLEKINSDKEEPIPGGPATPQ